MPPVLSDLSTKTQKMTQKCCGHRRYHHISSKNQPSEAAPPTVIGYQSNMFQAYLPKKRKIPLIPYKKKGSLHKSFSSMLNHAVKIHHPMKTKCCYCYTAGFLEPLMGFGAKIDAFSRNVRTRSVG